MHFRQQSLPSQVALKHKGLQSMPAVHAAAQRGPHQWAGSTNAACVLYASLARSPPGCASLKQLTRAPLLYYARRAHLDDVHLQDDDISISAWGTGSQWSTFAARLSPAANGEAGELLRLLHVAADHQGMLTAPLNVARAVAAATAIGRMSEGQLAAEAADDRPAAAGTAGGLVDALDPALYPARPAADASAAQVATAAGKGTALAALRREVTARSAAAAGAVAVDG